MIVPVLLVPYIYRLWMNILYTFISWLVVRSPNNWRLELQIVPGIERVNALIKALIVMLWFNKHQCWNRKCCIFCPNFFHCWHRKLFQCQKLLRVARDKNVVKMSIISFWWSYITTKDVFGIMATESKVVKIGKSRHFHHFTNQALLDKMSVAKDRLLNTHHTYVIFHAGGVGALTT